MSYHDFHPLSTEKLKRSRLIVKGEAVSEGSNKVTVFELEVRNLIVTKHFLLAVGQCNVCILSYFSSKLTNVLFRFDMCNLFVYVFGSSM